MYNRITTNLSSNTKKENSVSKSSQKLEIKHMSIKN